jgi:hypothetical protein
MSDREIILGSLTKAARRLRTNRVLEDLGFTFSVFLLFPVALKIWDLFSPFRGKTLVIVLTLWGASLLLYSVHRFVEHQRHPLEQVAAQMDTKAALRDELKTAYWFIAHPRSSDWIDGQISRASKSIGRLNIDRLCPRVIPRTCYITGSLLVILIGLNFLPLPWNHNWIYLEAAPPQDNIDVADAIKRLNEIQKVLHDKVLDNATTDKKLQEAAESLQQGNPADTSAKINEVSEDLQSSADKLNNPESQDEKGAMEQAAQMLKQLSKQIMDQQLKPDGESQPGEGETIVKQVETEDTENTPAEVSQNGSSQPPGQDPSGKPGTGKPPEIPSIENLKVQLEQEQLTSQFDEELKPEDIEKASKQERSKLDYRNVPSDLRAAQKELLNQESIPYQYQQLIRNYFAAIQRPRKEK